MVDINISLLIQLGNFLVLLVALHVILFKPIRSIMLERSQAVSGAYSDAKAAQDRMQGLLERYNASLAEAKQKAAAAYHTLYQQGLDAQRDMIAEERTRASEQLDRARSEIAAAAGAARADLKAETEKLSREISAALLGRAV